MEFQLLVSKDLLTHSAIDDHQCDIGHWNLFERTFVWIKSYYSSWNIRESPEIMKYLHNFDCEERYFLQVVHSSVATTWSMICLTPLTLAQFNLPVQKSYQTMLSAKLSTTAPPSWIKLCTGLVILVYILPLSIVLSGKQVELACFPCFSLLEEIPNGSNLHVYFHRP